MRLFPLIVLSGALTLAIGKASAQGSSAPTPGGDSLAARSRLLLAVEDTLDLTDRYKIDPLIVQAERLRIGEIVRLCIEHEEALQERIDSHVFTQFLKTVMHVGGYGEDAEKLLVLEEVTRVHFRKPDEHKVVPLKQEWYILEDGEKKPWEEAEEEGGEVSVRYEEFHDLPFYLEDEDEYDFRILSREIVGDHVVYEVEFKPKSDFEIAPVGKILIDTSSFQILREEFDFGDRVPMPLVVKSIGPVIRERQRIGDLWVWKRILVRADLRLGWLRFVEKNIPDTVEFVVLFRDHQLNEGWPEVADGDQARE
jgi:hypothetical protein